MQLKSCLFVIFYYTYGGLCNYFKWQIFLAIFFFGDIKCKFEKYGMWSVNMIYNVFYKFI